MLLGLSVTCNFSVSSGGRIEIEGYRRLLLGLSVMCNFSVSSGGRIEIEGYR